jgi:hypothetical protein
MNLQPLPLPFPRRWMSLRIDFLGGLFAAGLAAYLIYVPNERVLSSDIGFTLTMASTRLVPDFYWIDY